MIPGDPKKKGTDLNLQRLVPRTIFFFFECFKKQNKNALTELHYSPFCGHPVHAAITLIIILIAFISIAHQYYIEKQ